ncbi:MAG: McrC family protein [Actinobacteria bacterium]|nr:McrC family protein [Actinomycetota bacterium]
MTLALAEAEADIGTVILRESVPSEWSADVIERASGREWSALRISVLRQLGDPEGLWRLRADRYVGVAEFGSADTPLRVRIDPKIDADLFLLSDWAFGRTRDVLATEALTAHIDVLRREPAAVLLGWYLASLESFVVRWLRRDFQLRQEVLVGRVRGHILMTEYVRRHVAGGRPHHVPCEYLEATRDTLPNQILRRALHEVAGLIPTLSVPAARRHLQAAVGRVEPYLSGVRNHAVAPGDFKRVRLGRSQRHYEPILRKSEAILSGFFFSHHFGAHAQRAFLWDASLLFQEALRGVLGSWEGATLDSSRGRASLVDGNGHRRYSSKVDPDYVLRSSQGTLVLDAKWKNVIVGAAPPPTEDEDSAEVTVGRGTRIRISRSDIYQAVSYAQHERYAPCETGLVYPIALGDGDALPRPMRVTGFGRPVWILFMDVGYGGQRRFGSFFESLESCRLP